MRLFIGSQTCTSAQPVSKYQTHRCVILARDDHDKGSVPEKELKERSLRPECNMMRVEHEGKQPRLTRYHS